MHEIHILIDVNFHTIFLICWSCFDFKEVKINKRFIQPWRHSNIFSRWAINFFPFWKNCFIHKSIDETATYIKYRCRFSLILTSPSSAHFVSAYFMLKETLVFLFYPSKLKRKRVEREREREITMTWRGKVIRKLCILKSWYCWVQIQ